MGLLWSVRSGPWAAQASNSFYRQVGWWRVRRGSRCVLKLRPPGLVHSWEHTQPLPGLPRGMSFSVNFDWLIWEVFWSGFQNLGAGRVYKGRFIFISWKRFLCFPIFYLHGLSSIFYKSLGSAHTPPHKWFQSSVHFTQPIRFGGPHFILDVDLGSGE